MICRSFTSRPSKLCSRTFITSVNVSITSKLEPAIGNVSEILPLQRGYLKAILAHHYSFWILSCLFLAVIAVSRLQWTFEYRIQKQVFWKAFSSNVFAITYGNLILLCIRSEFIGYIFRKFSNYVILSSIGAKLFTNRYIHSPNTALSIVITAFFRPMYVEIGWCQNDH